MREGILYENPSVANVSTPLVAPAGLPDAPSGIGIGLRRAHFDSWLERAERDEPLGVDWIEFVPEVFMGVGGKTKRVLDALRQRTRLVPHGVSLSLGGPDAWPDERMSELHRLCSSVDATYYSDHICLASIDGIETFDLLPLPFCEEAADHVAARARMAKERLERPLVLENITYYAHFVEPELSEGEFVRSVVERSDAGLLLDVSNIVVNAYNHRRDPIELLEALPLERTVQIHLAGHRWDETWGLWIDDHASAVPDPALRLYEYALQRIGRPVPTLIEWDQRLPELDTVLAEIDRVRNAQPQLARAS